MEEKIFESGIFRVHQCGLDLSAGAPQGGDGLPPVLVLLAGFPDTAQSWDRLAPQFEKTHHILKLAMPGYESETLPSGHRWGFSMQEIVDSLALDVIEPYVKQGCKIHFVGHDWGAFVALIYTTQGKRVDKLLLLDIGIQKEVSKMNFLLQLSYQLFLAFVFFVSRLLPRENWAMILFILFPWNLIGPCPYETEKPCEQKNLKIHMAYPYFQLFLLLFSVRNGLDLINFKPDVPQLFVYGGKKRCFFHSQSYLDQLDASQTSKAVKVEDAGHWLHWTHTATVAHEMKLFLNR